MRASIPHLWGRRNRGSGRYAETFCRAIQSSRSLSRSTLPRSLFGSSVTSTDLLRRLGGRQELAAVRQHHGLGQRLVLRHHVADDLFAVDLVRHADRGGLRHAGMLDQDLVDLQRRDVDAAADDQVLGAAGDADEALRILDAEIAGLDALAVERIDRAVVVEIADRHLRPADRDLALDAGRAFLALRIGDHQLLMQRRKPDRAHLLGVVAVAADPAGLRHAVHLQQRDAVHLLELRPLLRGQRRRRAAHQPERRDVLRGVADRLVEQHVQHGRHAGRERDAVLLDPFEEAAVREALGHVHGQALLQERHQRQHLRRVPAERAVFQRAVVFGEAQKFQRVEAVHPVGGVVVDHDLRPRRGARGAEDAGGVVRVVALGQGGRVAFRQCGKQFVLRVLRAVRRPGAEAHLRRGGVAGHRRDVDVLVIEDQLGLQRRGERHHLLLVDLEIERAHHRADAPHAHPDHELFEILVGQHQDAAALLQALALEISRDIDGGTLKLAERDRRAAFEIDDGGLGGIAPGVFRQQVAPPARRES